MRFPTPVFALLTVALLISCTASERRGITVSAAASLTFAFRELGPLFEARTGVHPVFNFASSGHLAHQIAAGAPVDVFASANRAYIDELADQGLIAPGSVRTFGRGRLVIWCRGDQPDPPQSVADLAGPAVRRFAIGHPEHAPYGAAAREALQGLGLWETLQPKLVLGESVRQALHYAERGDVDAALVSLSLAWRPQAADIEGRWEMIPDSLHRPIEQTIGTVAGRPLRAEARQFVEFLESAPGRRTLERHGFTVADGN